MSFPPLNHPRHPRSILAPLLIAIVACQACATASPPAAKRGEAVAAAPPAPAASTLDARVQRIASEELERAIAEWEPAAAMAIVLDPKTGHVLAMEGRVGGKDDPSIATNRAYVTGSTLKIFTIGAALEAGTIAENAVVDCTRRTYGTAELYDGVPREKLSLSDVLVTSSNVGASRVYDTLGLEGLLTSLRHFHFDEAPGHLPDVTDGTGMEAAMLAIGESAEASPLQIAAAYAAIWNEGNYVRPTMTAKSQPAERVLRPETARVLAAMLEAAVVSDIGTGKLARIDNARVAGKTGTARIDSEGHLYSSFVGTILDQGPPLVTLVGLEAPKNGGSGPAAAAPLFARIAKRIATEAPSAPNAALN